MAKNIMPDIAELLGVEINEEFDVYEAETGKYARNKISILENKIVARPYDDEFSDYSWRVLSAEDLNRIFNGELIVKRAPFKPKINEAYWSYSGNNFNIVVYKWSNTAEEQALLKAGWIFRTKAEAERELANNLRGE